MGLGVVGAAGGSAPEGSLGLGKTITALKQATQIVVGIGIVRLCRYGPQPVRLRIGFLAHADRTGRRDIQYHDVGRMRAEDPFQQRLGLGKLPAGIE